MTPSCDEAVAGGGKAATFSRIMDNSVAGVHLVSDFGQCPVGDVVAARLVLGQLVAA